MTVFLRISMDNVQIELERIETELGEWKETLGDNFSPFLCYTLMARLMKAEKEIRYLRSFEAYR